MRSGKQEHETDGGALCAQGEQDARALTVTGTARAKRDGARLETALRTLRRAHARQSDADETGAAEWLLDNWYLAEREGRAALGDFQSAHRLRTAAAAAAPETQTQTSTVLSACCMGLVRACGADGLSLAAMEAYLEGFQRALPLVRAELELLIPGLKAAVIRRLAEYYSGTPDDGGETAGALFSALRLLGTMDFSALLERVDCVEQIFSRDPAGVYPKMDERTRAHYRRTVTKLARKLRRNEIELAQALLDRAAGAEGEARHVGWQLFCGETEQPRRRSDGGWYIAAVLLLTLFLSLLCGFATRSVSGAVLLLLPVSELVKNLLDDILVHVIPPRQVPRMELAGGVPREGKTICVISALLTKPEDAQTLARRLEEFRLGNRDAGENLLFGILADLPEGDAETAVGDAACIDAGAAAIDALNARYGGGFYLLTRKRVHSGADGVWRGRERKRGALLALARLLLDRETELFCAAGDAAALTGTRYILTLDSDTTLSPGTARELIGAMLHPLNRPVVDEQRGAVVRGYGLLHPRMAVELKSATASDFARVFAGQGGTDPYGTHCGELYMDLFDRGGFAGKGILDAAALLQCCERAVPENRVLSHDALEGAYLHGGYLGDVELTDSFPASPLSYYARMERWTRGDWQNLPWLFRRGRHFAPIDRWKLFDSLRRSLVPPATFLAMFLGFTLRWPGLRLAAWAALLSLLSRFLLSLGESALRPEQERRVRYHSTIIHGAAGALVQTVLRLMLLPWEAWVCASAAAKALWRMAVSHRNLLAWQTAAQSDQQKRGTLRGYVGAMWPAMALGLLTVVCSPSIAGKTVGVVWVLSPALTKALARQNRPRPALSNGDREYLKRAAEEIWGYFETFCTEEDNALPPDNWQEQPPVGAAHRTSPTNIGLALVSALCAHSLGVDHGRGIPLVERMLDTMEQLPKWHGHFYNWYHTCTLRPLRPAYVSTVDSGNLAASLVAVRSALAELGRGDLAQRAGALLDAMDFSPLYDESRRLFRIGIDTRTGEPSPGWYDLLSSEARLTGYVAIAKGDVDRRHWRRLSRAQVQKDHYRGMVSWTGTMFEYLMPELFLPLAKESLLWESAKFCLYAQRRRVPPGKPWGISESAYYALDPALNYRYKAHGVAALALRRGMDKELVVSPYSSFLALAVEPRAAVRNLRRLDALGLRGPYGFREAVDFTPARCRGRGGEIVQCVMAHHLGMSLTAICNGLDHGRVQRWFMADPAMHAYTGLLEERVPIGGVLLRRRGRSQTPEKPGRPAENGYVRTGAGTDAEHPACCLLSNGGYHLLVAETGQTFARWQDVSVCRRGDRSAPGEAPALRLLRDGYYVNLFPTDGDDGARIQWRFTERSATLTGLQDDLKYTCDFAVSAKDNGELRALSLSAAGGLPDGELHFTLEPVLAPYLDYGNHPAFYRMGFQAKTRGGALLLRRLARSSTPEVWLCLACDRALRFPDSVPGWLSDARIDAVCPVRLAPDEVFEARFALGVGRTEEAAFQAAQRTLTMPSDAFAALPALFAAQTGMDGGDVAAAMALVSPLVFPAAAPEVGDLALLKKDALWRFGISGDLPILCAVLTKPAHRAGAAALIRRHALLQSCGLRSDLVFLTAEGGDYQRSGSRIVTDTLRALDREALLNAAGGVHLAELSQAAAIEACAAVTLDLEHPEYQLTRCTLPARLAAPDRRDLPQGCMDWHWRDDGAFVFQLSHALPKRAWCHVLTNGRFGYLAADSGLGHMWVLNAREGRVNRWRNDPHAVRGTETLELLSRGGRTSLFADGMGEARVEYGFGYAMWEKEWEGVRTRVTAFVPWDTDARVLLLECSADAAEIAWSTELLLAGDERDALTVVTAGENGVLTAVNPRSGAQFSFSAVCSEPLSGWTCDRFSFLRGQSDQRAGTGLTPCMSMEFTLRRKAILVCGCAGRETLLRLTQPAEALHALEETRSRWRAFVYRLRAELPDAAMGRFVSGWAAYQTLACRILARTSVYQSGGAFGFRDQLQDAVNLILLDPDPARAQILLCCAHQFTQGDVCHWWHSGAGQEHGVRTRISDDLLWLPWAVCEYVEKTGDRALCRERVAYLLAEALSDCERERYAPLTPAPEDGTVFDHCLRALAMVLRRGTGAHGLLHIGSGDWNDGLDRVGARGDGESVWLTWFFSHTAHRFADLLDRLGDAASAAQLRAAAQKTGRAADSAWDGAWYLRGYFDDGTPLGSAGCAECRIDSIAQSFAALCPEASSERKQQALTSALDALFDREHNLVKLFDPPFTRVKPDPGYVRSYGPGFRENGGQYTHGALWLAMALLREGRTDDGYALLQAVLPQAHDPERYEAEPFVLAADVCTGDAAEQAGWTWYTGSSGWFLRVTAEDLLGLKLRGGVLYPEPKLPSAWNGCTVHWRDGAGLQHTIAISRDGITVDGKPYTGGGIGKNRK